MIDETNNLYKELKNTLKDKVAENKIVCPVNIMHLLELASQSSKEKRLKISALMEEFSNSIGFRHINNIFTDEYKYILRNIEGDLSNLKIPKTTAFSHFIEFFGVGTLDFGHREVDITKTKEMSKKIFQKLSKFHLYQILENASTPTFDLLKNRKNLIKNLVINKNVNNQEVNNDIEELIAEETKNFIKTFEKEIIKTSLIAFKNSDFIEKTNNGWFEKVNTVENLLRSPFAFNCIYLHAYFQYSKPKMLPNDLDDIIHLICPLYYCDLVAMDNFMRHISKDVLNLDAKYSTQITSDPEELLDFLKVF